MGFFHWLIWAGALLLIVAELFMMAHPEPFAGYEFDGATTIVVEPGYRNTR